MWTVTAARVLAATLQDKKLAWYDLDLSTKPYRSLRYHEKALRGVAYHARHPLFASASDDGALHVFHGMVYQVGCRLGRQWCAEPPSLLSWP